MAPGSLYLIPNTLDFGTPAESSPIDEVLPTSVLVTAARLTHWVAENAKTTRAFLKRVGLVTPLLRPLQELSIVELPRPRKGGAAQDPAPAALDPLLAPAHQGHDLGLISEAGLPGVADPGAALVQAAHRSGVRVVALAGPSSLVLALAASGLNGQSFAFVGYLPVDSGSRAARIRDLESLSRRHGQTQLMIETPYRNEALLNALLGQLQPATRLSVSCGLTLPDGHTRTDTVQGWRARPQTLPGNLPVVFAFLA
ncbi:MAG: SAM-dependent methyltransferase [Pseudomonadota bacterium]|nr:SAM-dependent methyltransferase [Pseudomonadota bacterium]